MNKVSKPKNSSRTTKSSRNMTAKYSCATNSQTPQSKQVSSQSRKHEMQKFKSIPTITYPEQENTEFLNNNFIYQSYTTHQEQMGYSQVPEPRLLYSVSDRNHVSTHKSLRSKVGKESKKTGANSKQKTVSTMKTIKPPLVLQQVLERTQLVLKVYKQRQQVWRKQKEGLLKELQRYRPNKKKRKSSILALKNHKPLLY